MFPLFLNFLGFNTLLENAIISIFWLQGVGLLYG